MTKYVFVFFYAIELEDQNVSYLYDNLTIRDGKHIRICNILSSFFLINILCKRRPKEAAVMMFNNRDRGFGTRIQYIASYIMFWMLRRVNCQV